MAIVFCNLNLNLHGHRLEANFGVLTHCELEPNEVTDGRGIHWVRVPCRSSWAFGHCLGIDVAASVELEERNQSDCEHLVAKSLAQLVVSDNAFGQFVVRLIRENIDDVLVVGTFVAHVSHQGEHDTTRGHGVDAREALGAVTRRGLCFGNDLVMLWECSGYALGMIWLCFGNALPRDYLTRVLCVLFNYFFVIQSVSFARVAVSSASRRSPW